MALANKPAITALQVGNFVWFMYNSVPVKAKIIKTISDVSNPNDDSSGVQSNSYYLEGYYELYPSSKLYSTRDAFIAATTAATPV